MSEKNEESFGGTIDEVIEIAEEVAEEVVSHPFAKWMARYGFYTKGFLFLVIGSLAVMVALSDRYGKLADPTGALATIAQITFGKILLIIFAFGALGHGLWNVLRGAADVDCAGKNWQGIIKRIISAGIGIFYFYLAWKAVDLVLSVQITDENGTAQKTFVTILLSLPLGAILVGLIGMTVIGAGIHEFFSGITGKYQNHLRMYEVKDKNLTFLNILGYFGLIARGLIFLLIGYYFISAAFYLNPQVAVGLDGALLKLSQGLFGQFLLFFTALGLMCYGLLSIYEARYRRLC